MRVWAMAAALLLGGAVQQQPAASRLTFETATIKPSGAYEPGKWYGMKPKGGMNGYDLMHMPVRDTIAFTYKVPRRQVVGGPEWLDHDLFDIDARADRVYTLEELHTMVKNLLADRFGLKMHTDTREGNVYALRVDPKGLKMMPVPTPIGSQPPLASDGIGSFHASGMPIPQLCWVLSGWLQADERPVIDRTGLTGTYDFSLKFRPELPSGFKGALPEEAQDRPDLYTALREQMGLRLSPERGPMELLVIDHVERPTAN